MGDLKVSTTPAQDFGEIENTVFSVKASKDAIHDAVAKDADLDTKALIQVSGKAGKDILAFSPRPFEVPRQRTQDRENGCCTAASDR